MPPDFSPKTIDILARRAALRCSNPDCDKITTGPNSDPLKSTNIGEAAHIYGARPGTARFRTDMSDVERALISNGIWVCRDCHGLLDRDAHRFPSPLLFKWKEAHEAKITRELGKPSEKIQLSIQDEEINALPPTTPFVKQIFRDKPDHWEYIATAELLDHFLKPAMQKADALRRGLYSKPLTAMEAADSFRWIALKSAELINVVDSLKALFGELMEAWAPLGTPPDPQRLIRACELYGNCATRLVDIAEEAKFSHPPEVLQGSTNLMKEGALWPVDRLTELSKFLRGIVGTPGAQGTYEFTMTVDLPPDWEKNFSKEIRKAERAYGLRWL